MYVIKILTKDDMRSPSASSMRDVINFRELYTAAVALLDLGDGKYKVLKNRYGSCPPNSVDSTWIGALIRELSISVSDLPQATTN